MRLFLENANFQSVLDFTPFRNSGSAGTFGGAILKEVPIVKGNPFGLDPFQRDPLYPFLNTQRQ